MAGGWWLVAGGRPQAAVLAALLLGACASTGGARGEPPPPDEAALATETRVEALAVAIVMSERLREGLSLKAIRVDEPEPGKLRARGSAVLRLKKLVVEAETIEITFLAEHQDFLLHAREVKRFQQQKGFGHRTEDADAVTMANDKVSIFQQ